jgi:hypothetical protein
MENNGAELDLRALAPAEAVWWGIERETDGQWRRLSKANGNQGPKAKIWPMNDLTAATILSCWGGGTFRLLWVRVNRRGRVGSSRPLYLEPPRPQAAAATTDLDMDDELADELTQTRGTMPDYDPADLSELDYDSPLAQLDPERLSAVLQGRPADTDGLGRGMGILERLNALYLSMNRSQWQMMRHEVDMVTAQANARVELARVEAEARSRELIEQNRMFYQRVTDVSERAQQLDSEARAADQADELAGLRETLQAVLDQSTTNAEGQRQISAEQEDAVSVLIKQAGPEILKQIAAKLLNVGNPIPLAMGGGEAVQIDPEMVLPD